MNKYLIPGGSSQGIPTTYEAQAQQVLQHPGHPAPDMEYYAGGPHAANAETFRNAVVYNLTLTNGNVADRIAQVSPGLTYVRGSEANGVIKTGAFNDINGDVGLEGAGDPRTIEEFLSHIANNPMICLGFQIRSDKSAQLDKTVTIARQTPFDGTDQNSRTIHLPSYTSEHQYNDRQVSVGFKFLLGHETVFKVPVAGSSTLNLLLYFGAQTSLSDQMRRAFNIA